jgi:DNA-binding CsgD family transcriptional regulator
MTDYAISPELDRLIAAIYQGPLEEKLWQGFLELFRQAVAADYATLLLRPPKEGDQGVVLNAVIHSFEIYNAYNETYFALDPFVDLPVGSVSTLQEFMPAEELIKSEYYRQYMAPAGVFRILGADMSEPDGFTARLRISRCHGAEDFGEQEKQLTQMLVPHLQQSIQIHSRIVRMEAERNLYENAIDHLEMGAIILDESAKILRTNQVADFLLQERQGLRVVDGRLQVGSREDNIRFRELIDEVLLAHKRSEPGFIRAFRLNRNDGRSGFGLLIRPLPISDSPSANSNPSIAIFISDPERPCKATLDVLKQLFEFTPSEASLALLLANGLTLDETSEELGITRNTAKSHLSSIFSKTGVTRQSKLVQLILKSVASMG